MTIAFPFVICYTKGTFKETRYSKMTNKLMRTSDGKIFAFYKWDDGVIHQQVLEINGDDRGATFSMDGGEHWDWEYGWVDQNKKRSGWYRRGEA